MPIGQAWRSVRDRLRETGSPTAELDARQLAEMVFGIRGLDLIAHERDPASAEALAVLEGLTQRRLSGEPVARIAGEKEFYGLSFKLAPATLVPRPETEMLVDLALARLNPTGEAKILDLGTGTGCIAIAILVHLPAARVMAVDLSDEAVACARENAKRHGVAGRFEARTGSWFSSLRGETFDLIVSNPPYIESAVIDRLAPDVRDHDPRTALDGGRDGLNAYRAIAFSASLWLKPKGLLAVEIGSTQGAAVRSLFSRGGFKDAETIKDLAGLDRVVFAHHL